MSKKRFSAFLFFLLLLALCLSVVPTGALTAGSFSYSLINNDTEVSITGYSGTGGVIEIPEKIDGKPVTKIGNYALQGNTDITGVRLPDSLKTIGMQAFCNCSELKTVESGEGLESIGYGSFSGCTSLASIDLPEGLTSIGSGAFFGCKSLASIDLPDGVTSIGSSAFYRCSLLESIILPDGVTEIGQVAFSECTKLKTVVFGKGIQSIGVSAFNGCSSLESALLPDGLTEIGKYAFDGCSGLKTVVFGSSLRMIDSLAFCACSSLEEIVLPDSLTTLDTNVFNSCYSLKTAVVGSGLTSLTGATFANCSALETVVLPEGLTEIGDHAFSHCSGLKTVFFAGDKPDVRPDNGDLTGAAWKIAPSSEGFGADAEIAPAARITFDAGGGRIVSPLTGEEGDSYTVLSFGGRIPAPVDPVRDGYCFAGWRSESSPSEKIDFSTRTAAGDEKFTALWQRSEGSVSGSPVFLLSGASFSAQGEETAQTLTFLNESPGFSGCSLLLEWDPAALGFVSFTFGSGMTGTSLSSSQTAEGRLTVSFNGTTSLGGKDKETVGVLKLKVLPGAGAENLVSLSVKKYTAIFSVASRVPAKNGKIYSAEKLALSPSADGAAIRVAPSLNGVPLFDRALEISGKETAFSSLASLFTLPEGTEIRISLPGGESPDPSAPIRTGTVIELLRGEETVESLPCLIKGDGDGSGTCDVFDAVSLLTWIVNGEANPLRAAARCALNVDGSDTVDVFDAVAILTYIVRGGWE